MTIDRTALAYLFPAPVKQRRDNPTTRYGLVRGKHGQWRTQDGLGEVVREGDRETPWIAYHNDRPSEASHHRTLAGAARWLA